MDTFLKNVSRPQFYVQIMVFVDKFSKALSK